MNRRPSKKSRHTPFPFFRYGVLAFVTLSLLATTWFLSTSAVQAAALVQSAQGTKRSNQGSPTTVTATYPAPATAGRLLIAVVAANGDAAIAEPVGWSTAVNQSGTVSQAIFYKQAAGGETTMNATVSANPGSIGLHIYEYSGATTLNAISSNTGSGNAPSSGSIVTSQADELVFAAFVTRANTSYTNASWNNAGEGFTERRDFNTSGLGRIAAYAGGDNLTNTAGTKSVAVATGASAAWRGQIVSFQVHATPPGTTTESSKKARPNQYPKNIAFSILPEGCTTNRKVRLLLHAHDASEVKISNLPDLSDAQWQPFDVAIDHAAMMDWTLSDGDGEKTVYVVLKNGLLGLESGVQTASVRMDETTLCHSAQEHAHIMDLENKIEAVETNPECLSDYAHASIEPYLIEPDGAMRGWRDQYVRVTPLSLTETRYAFEDGQDQTFDDIVVRVERAGEKASIHLEVNKSQKPHTLFLRVEAADRGTIENILLWTHPSALMQEPKEIDLGKYKELCASDLVPHPHPGDLFQSPSSGVYYFGRDKKRHAFPNADVVTSWFSTSTEVMTVAGYQLTEIPLGESTTLRPGVLTRIMNNLALYIVDVGRQLRLILLKSDLGARAPSFEGSVYTLNPAFVTNYIIGYPVLSGSDPVITLFNGTSTSIDDLWPTPKEDPSHPRTHTSKVLDGRVVLEQDHYELGDVEIRFRILGKDGKALTANNLIATQAKVMHLLVIRDDFTGYQHIHPEEHEGTWSVKTNFGKEGRYYLFGDIVPINEPPVIVRMPIFIGGDPQPGTDFPAPTPNAATRDSEGSLFRVELLTKELVAGQEIPLTFAVTKNGKPFEDIQPWLEEHSHVIILKHNDHNVFIHTHPSDESALVQGELGFRMRFPYPGRYTLYAQFSLDGAVRDFPITVDVRAKEALRPIQNTSE